eukprot:gene5308-26532_t
MEVDKLTFDFNPLCREVQSAVFDQVSRAASAMGGVFSVPGSISTMGGGHSTFDPRSPAPADGTFQRTPIAKLNGSLLILPGQSAEMTEVTNIPQLRVPPPAAHMLDPRSPVPSRANYARTPMQSVCPPASTLFDPRSPAPADAGFSRTPMKTIRAQLQADAWDPRSPGMLNRTPLVDVVEAKASAKELETGEQAAAAAAAAAAVEGGKVAGNEHSGAAVAAGSEVGEKEEEEEGPIAQPTFDDVDVGVGVDDVMESVRDILGSLPKELSMPQSENNENADALGSIAAFSKKTTSKIEMKVSLSKRKTSKAALIGGSESSPRQALGGITNSPTHSPARQIKMQMAMRSASSPARKQSSLFSQLAPNASSPQMVELTSV